MAERSSLNQTVQIGVEATAGTAVWAGRRLQSIGFEPSPSVEMDQFRPMGQKYRALTTLGKEWTESSISGRGSYTELVYVLASVVNTPVITTPAGATDARLWTFTSDPTEDDTPKTFTMEHGSDVRAARMSYSLITEFGMTFNRQSIEVSGSMMSRALTDGITRSESRTVTDASITSGDATLTSASATFVAADVGKFLRIVGQAGFVDYTTILSVTNGTTIEMADDATATATGQSLEIGAIRVLDIQPIIPTQICVTMDTTFGALGTTKLTRLISAEFTLGNRFAGVWVLDCENPSFVNHIESEPDLTLNMTLQADAQGMGLLNTLRSGDTRFVQIEAEGVNVESGYPHRFQLDMAVKVADTNGFSDQDGVYAVEFSFVGVADGGWGKAFEFQLTNGLLTL